MNAYELRLIDDLQAAINSAKRILERDVSRIGAPCPNLAELAAVRTQLSQALMTCCELYGAKSK